MRGFSKAIITGNLTRDPELRTTPNGATVASFSVETAVMSRCTPVTSSMAWNMAASLGSEISFRNGGHACQ